jgi:hypothetical protein
MNAYLVSVSVDRPGVLARLLAATAARGVNVAPAYGLADGRNALICLGSDDEAGLQAAIADAGLSATAIEMVVTELENRPGTGAELFGKLAAAGVSLLVAVPVGMSGDRVQFALGATDPALVKATLGL